MLLLQFQSSLDVGRMDRSPKEMPDVKTSTVRTSTRKSAVIRVLRGTSIRHRIASRWLSFMGQRERKRLEAIL